MKPSLPPPLPMMGKAAAVGGAGGPAEPANPLLKKKLNRTLSNRVAAQKSREKKKHQFASLQARVEQLEREKELWMMEKKVLLQTLAQLTSLPLAQLLPPSLLPSSPPSSSLSPHLSSPPSSSSSFSPASSPQSTPSSPPSPPSPLSAHHDMHHHSLSSLSSPDGACDHGPGSDGLPLPPSPLDLSDLPPLTPLPWESQSPSALAEEGGLGGGAASDAAHAHAHAHAPTVKEDPRLSAAECEERLASMELFVSECIVPEVLLPLPHASSPGLSPLPSPSPFVTSPALAFAPSEFGVAKSATSKPAVPASLPLQLGALSVILNLWTLLLADQLPRAVLALATLASSPSLAASLLTALLAFQAPAPPTTTTAEGAAFLAAGGSALRSGQARAWSCGGLPQPPPASLTRATGPSPLPHLRDPPLHPAMMKTATTTSGPC